jgi:hypothetical protein
MSAHLNSIICQRDARIAELETALESVECELAINMPCGGIGEDGPTIQEMDDYIEVHQRPMEDDAVYHCTQRAWRICADVLEGKK